jgi:hypothetical protein
MAPAPAVVRVWRRCTTPLSRWSPPRGALLDGEALGVLRVADHTLVPGTWIGEPVQVTLEFLARAPR